MAITQLVHEKLFALLRNWNAHNAEMNFFALRKTNRYEKLDKGIWFHGNENYLSFSFWAGTDWKNKTSNINLIVSEDLSLKLQLTAGDSEEKLDLLKTKIGPLFNANFRSWRSDTIDIYPSLKGKYIKAIEKFIIDYKSQIDDIISEFNIGNDELKFYRKNAIRKFYFEEFNLFFTKTEEYRKKFKTGFKGIQHQISDIEISNYRGIQKISLKIPRNIRWIFITGENGFGKTTLLQGIFTGLYGNYDEVSGKILENTNFKTEIKTFDGNKKKNYKFINKKDNFKVPNKKSVFENIVGYGSSRLLTSSKVYNNEKHELNSNTRSLFSDENELYNIEHLLTDWYYRSSTNNFGLKYDNTIAALKGVLEGYIADIYVDERLRRVKYQELDLNEAPHKPMFINELATSFKSLIAMVGDLMVRLYEQQPEIDDPAALVGIVLIDEIEIHLHPKLQREFPSLLQQTFPKIQFVVSTHSPLTILGAPKDAVIINVSRDVERGTTAKILDIDVSNLLPNTILTSPIFSVDELSSESNKEIKKIIVDDSYYEKDFFDLVDKKTDEYIKKIASKK